MIHTAPCNMWYFVGTPSPCTITRRQTVHDLLHFENIHLLPKTNPFFQVGAGLLKETTQYLDGITKILSHCHRLPE